MKKIKQKSGITALELLITTSIVALLLVTVLPQFKKMQENSLLNNSTENVISALNKARSQSLASLGGLKYGVRFAANSIIIFKCENTSLCPSNTTTTTETINILTPAKIYPIPSPSEFYFERLSGKPSAAGSVVVIIEGSIPSNSKTITISSTGAISF
jgi:type II secretory pathway pseudopilin PulG